MALGSVRPKSDQQDRSLPVVAGVGRGPWLAARRRRRVPLLAVGGLLVIVCVLGFAYGAVRLGDRVQVLAVARPVAAGQALTGADLRAVSAARDPGVPLVAASDTEQVVGRTAVVPLLPGTLLTPSLVGEAAFPPPGKVTASIAVKPGQYPQGLAPGARVEVYVSTNVAAPGAGAAAPGGGLVASSSAPALSHVDAAVLGVDVAGDGQGATVITLLLDAAHGAELAAAPPGGVVVMQSAPREG